MNEIVFLLQVGAVVASVMGAKKFGREALMTWAVLLAVFANFFVLKQITLFSWTVTCSDAYVIGHLICLNLLQQQEGKAVAQKTVTLSFSAMLLFALFAQIHLIYLPSKSDLSHAHYTALLGVAPRLFAASLFTFYVVQRIDLFLFGQWMKRFPHVSWRLRSTFSLVISQGLDTLLFTLLGLYGVVEDWVSIFWMSFGVKCGVIGIAMLSWREDQKRKYEI